MIALLSAEVKRFTYYSQKFLIQLKTAMLTGKISLLSIRQYGYMANVMLLPYSPVNRAVLMAKWHRNATVTVNEAVLLTNRIKNQPETVSN